MKKICFVLTSEIAVKSFLMSHIKALSSDYDISVLVNTTDNKFLSKLGIEAKVISLDIDRKINLISDLICLVRLIKLIKEHQFLAVHSVTPKAGLLAMLAAWVNKVPLRVHTFTGQVWANKLGFKRCCLKKLDCLIAFLTTHNIVDSPSQRQFLVDEQVIKVEKSIVFGEGSISGVDLKKFIPNLHVKNNIREQLNIEQDAFLFLFLGRLTRDKGVFDLAQAFTNLQSDGAYLLFVGPDEQDMQTEIESITTSKSSFIRFVAYTSKPEEFMAAADVLCLPSYREGFGSVIIEAAAVGIPAIASRIYGITDAVVDGGTGLLHEPHDVLAIQSCMTEMINNQDMRLQLGEKARLRACKDFDSNLITAEWVKFYHERLR